MMSVSFVIGHFHDREFSTLDPTCDPILQNPLFEMILIYGGLKQESGLLVIGFFEG